MTLSENEKTRLGRKIAGLLRHYGPKYGLNLDAEGWTTISELVKTLRKIKGFEQVEEKHVIEVILTDDKGRFEIKGDKVRARYGHSLPVKINYKLVEKPPKKLYHGTVKSRVKRILREGLLPMKRRYVHLSYTVDDAYRTGMRHGKDVVILVIDTACLRDREIPLYYASHSVVVTTFVPPECISVLDKIL